MRRKLLTLIGTYVALALVLSGCAASAVRLERKIVLLRAEDGRRVIVDSQDALYDTLENVFLADPTFARWLTLYDQTADAFLSTNLPNSMSGALRSKPIMVVDSPRIGVLRNVEIQHEGETLRIELALGIGQDGQLDLPLLRQRFPSLMASWLLALMELDTFQGDPATLPRVYEPTTPSLAFELGFGVALDAVYAQEWPQVVGELYEKETLTDEELDLLYRYVWVPANGLRYRFEGNRPTATLRPRDEAARTPGVVGAFLYQLLRRTGSFYPQRYIIWMVSYDDQTKPYGKLLLALARMPRREGMSIRSFIEAYVDTFPAEEAQIRALADEVFGKGP